MAYTDRYIDHQIFVNISTVQETLKSLIKLDDVTESLSEEIARLIELVSYSHDKIKSADHNWLPENLLSQSNKLISGILSDLQNFKEGKDITHLINANKRADNLLIQVHQIPQIAYVDNRKTKEKIGDNYHKTISQIIQEIKKDKLQYNDDLNNIQEQITNLSKNIDNEKKRIDGSNAQFQAQFSDFQDSRREKFDQEIEKLKGELSALKSDYEGQFKSLRDSTSALFGETLSDFKKTSEASNIVVMANFEELLKEKTVSTDNLLLEMENKKEEARRILDVSTNVAITGQYNKIANQEKNAANILRWFSVFFMVLSIYFIHELISSITKDSIGVAVVVFRIGIVIVTLIPGFYLARESEKHREREIRNRKMELELASLGPYLEQLEPIVQMEIRKELTSKFFGQPVANENNYKSVNSNKINGMFEKIIDAVIKKI